MKHTIAFFSFLVVTSCYADSTSFVIASQRTYPPVSVKIELAAEYVAISVSITSSEKDALRNLENIQGVTSKLLDAVRKTQNIKFRQGTVSLSVNQGTEGGYSSFGSGNGASNSNLFLVSSLAKDRDIYQVTREIIAVVQSLPKNDQTRVTFGVTSLGIDDPERYRERLLPMIQKETEHVRSALGKPKSFEISGLENAVSVVQQDDKSVSIFIPYKLKVGQ